MSDFVVTLALSSFRPLWSQQDESKRMDANGDGKSARFNRLFPGELTPSDLLDVSD